MKRKAPPASLNERHNTTQQYALRHITTNRYYTNRAWLPASTEFITDAARWERPEDATKTLESLEGGWATWTLVSVEIVYNVSEICNAAERFSGIGQR